MTKTSEFGARLKRLRHQRGLTQREIGQAEYSAAYVSMVEAGRRSPSPRAVAHFADKLGMSPEGLLSGRPPDIEARLELRLQEGRAALYTGLILMAEEAFLDVDQQAARYGLTRLRAKAEVGKGRLAERSSDVEGALAHFETAERLLGSEPLPLRAEAIAGRARCHQTLGDIRYSAHILESYRLALLENELPDPHALMRTCSSLVWPYSELGLYVKAVEVAEESLSLASQVEDGEQIAGMHVNVARELLRQGRVADCLKSLDRAEQIYSSLNWPLEVARTMIARGIVARSQGNLEESSSRFRRALELLPQEIASRDRARCLNELAQTEMERGEPIAAVELLETARGLLQVGDVTELANVNHALGLCWKGRDPDLTEKYLRQAVELFDRADQPVKAAVALRDLGDTLESEGRLDAAREVYRQGLARL